MVEFGTSSAIGGWVRVRVLGYGFGVSCRFTTYRHRFARAAPAPRAKPQSVMTKRKIRRIVDVRRPSRSEGQKSKVT